MLISFPMPRQSRLTWAIAWLMAFAELQPVWAQDAALEYAVKATYLYKFAPFVAWPSPSAAYPGGAFTVCAVGHDAVGDLLERAVSGQQIAGHPIVVRHLANVTRDPGCSVLYVARSDDQVAADLAALDDAPVLTVTDGATDPAATGIINFVVVDGHVRFDINDSAAASRGLTVSSKLLSLAVHVIGPNR